MLCLFLSDVSGKMPGYSDASETTPQLSAALERTPQLADASDATESDENGGNGGLIAGLVAAGIFIVILAIAIGFGIRYLIKKRREIVSSIKRRNGKLLSRQYHVVSESTTLKSTCRRY